MRQSGSFKLLSFASIIVLSTITIIAYAAWRNTAQDEINTADSARALPEIIVYKSASCNCCHKWVTYLESEGFTVQSHNREDMNDVKLSLGVAPGLASCHTAIIGDYLIEGHIPADDIKRLLTEKPNNIVGLTAPGMPRHSPGMQAEGLAPKDYDVLTFDEKGNTEVFTRY